jgi:hypothetical protein
MRLLRATLLCLGPALLAQAPPPAPKPGPEMARLQAFVGTWKVEEIVEPGVMGPGGKGYGTSRVTQGPGGFSIHISYTSESPKGPMPGFHGEGDLLWDAEAKAYKQSWVDNMAPMLAVGTGHWEGDAFVMVSEFTMQGTSVKSVDRFTDISPKGFTLTNEASMNGGPMKKFMTLIHTRK